MRFEIRNHLPKILSAVIALFGILALVTAFSNVYRSEYPILGTIYTAISQLTPILIGATTGLAIIVLVLMLLKQPDIFLQAINIENEIEGQESDEIDQTVRATLEMLPPKTKQTYNEAVLTFDSGAYAATVLLSVVALKQGLSHWTGEDLVQIQEENSLENLVDQDLLSDIEYLFSKRDIVSHGVTKITKHEAEIALRTVAKAAKHFSGKQLDRDVEDEQTTEWNRDYSPEDVSVKFNSRTTDGKNIFIDRITVPNGGFAVVVSTPFDNVRENVIGTSEYLEPGTHENVIVELDKKIQDSKELYVFLWEDTNRDQELDLVGNDRPYTDRKGIVISDKCHMEVE